MWRRLAFVLALSAAACATPVGGVSTPSGTGQIPSTPIELGNWRAGGVGATLSAFQHAVTTRYAVGAPINAATADLRRNRFSCAAAPQTSADNRGAPPAQICRRTITAQGCAHTWQVHLFDTRGDRRLALTRSLYDRRCGADDLLGGP